MTMSRTSVKVESAKQGSAAMKSKAQDEKVISKSLEGHLRKTRMCAYYQQGTCEYGGACRFAHSKEELHVVPDLTKTRLCAKFMDGFGCNDENCNFAHGMQELQSNNLFHKKSLCLWNEKGMCRNGKQCRFAHGMEELQKYQGATPDKAIMGGQAPAANQTQRGPKDVSDKRRPHKVVSTLFNGKQGSMLKEADLVSAQDDSSITIVRPPPGLTLPPSVPPKAPAKASLDSKTRSATSVDKEIRAELEALRKTVQTLSAQCMQLQGQVKAQGTTSGDISPNTRLQLSKFKDAAPFTPMGGVGVEFGFGGRFGMHPALMVS